MYLMVVEVERILDPDGSDFRMVEVTGVTVGPPTVGGRRTQCDDE